jgi:hypothetical protein
VTPAEALREFLRLAEEHPARGFMAGVYLGLECPEVARAVAAEVPPRERAAVEVLADQITELMMSEEVQ